MRLHLRRTIRAANESGHWRFSWLGFGSKGLACPREALSFFKNSHILTEPGINLFRLKLGQAEDNGRPENADRAGCTELANPFLPINEKGFGVA
jgi:hypothetical protein